MSGRLSGKSVPVLCCFFLLSCMRVPVTNRRQVNMLPESTMMEMSFTQYETFLNENKKKIVAENNADAVMVREVGGRIAASVERFLKQEGKSKRVKGFAWQFKVVDDETVNAWCMPGGKVVVYTGLLPVTKDEEGLAVVMGHEIAHAIARHGNERFSQQLLLLMGGITLAVALSEKPEQTRNIFLQSYGITGTLGVLAYSRKHESEADKMGLVFMAMAGYNPEKAVAFWERMSQTGGAKPPELISTHPGDARRIADIKQFLPVAMTYYHR